METVDFPRFILAFLLVLGLIGLLALGLKRYGGATKNFLGAKEGEGRLRIVEIRYLDAKRRLMLVKRDEAEHLLLLADGRETVIEANIKKDNM